MSFNHEQLNDFRRRVIAQETVSEEELRQAVEYLITLRAGAASAAPVPKAPKVTKPKMDAVAAEQVLAGLLGGLKTS